jgi:rare lipoprotein A
MYAMSAAHKTLPLPSYIEVSNLDNGKKIVVRVNDRGPFHDRRIIDLSYAAAAKLGTLKNGTSRVEIRAINPTTGPSRALESPPNQLITVENSSLDGLGPQILPINQNNKGFLFIQVGAFKSLQNATQLKRKLTNELQTTVTVTPSSPNENALHLVRVGPYIKIRKADIARIQLQELGFKNIIYATD